MVRLRWGPGSGTLLLVAVVLGALACGTEGEQGRQDEPLAPGGAGGHEDPGVPPPVHHGAPLPLDVEVMGPEVGGPLHVRDLSVDAGGGLWVAADDGLHHRGAGEIFFDRIDRIPRGEIQAVGGLGPGLAAVSFRDDTAPQLVRVDADGRVSVRPLDLSPFVARFRGVETEEGWRVIAATGGGLAILDEEGRVLGLRKMPPPARELWDVALTATGDAWAAQADRLLLLQGPVLQSLAGSIHATGDLGPDGPAHLVAVEVCPDGTVWASALGEGVFHLDARGERLEQLRAEHVLPQDHVPALACDLDGSVWFGTSWGGLARRMPDGSFVYHVEAAGLPGDSIRRLLVVPDGEGGRSLWFGTEGGAARYDGP